MSSSKFSTSEAAKHIVIAGGFGLAGLATAITTVIEAKKNPEIRYHISLVEIHDSNFIRRQKVTITPTNLTDIEKTLKWDEFCKSIFDPNHDIIGLDNKGHLLFKHITKGEKTKAERFLQKLLRQAKIQQHNLYRNFSIKDLQTTLLSYLTNADNLPQNVNLAIHTQAKITEVNIQSKEVTITKPGEVINCKVDTLIICDGAKHETVNKVNESLPQVYFHYNKFKSGTPFFHAAVRMRLRSDFSYAKHIVKKPIQIQSINFKKSLEKLKSMGWPYDDSMPNVVVDSNAHGYDKEDPNFILRIFVGCEIIESIYKIENEEERRKQMIEWVKALLAMSYDVAIEEDIFEFDDKGETNNKKLNAVAFTSPMQYVTNPLLTLENGLIVGIVGDAAISSYYPAGISSTIVLQLSILLTKYFMAGQDAEKHQRAFLMSHQRYINALENIIKQLEKRALPTQAVTNDSIVLRPDDLICQQVQKNDMKGLKSSLAKYPEDEDLVSILTQLLWIAVHYKNSEIVQFFAR